MKTTQQKRIPHSVNKLFPTLILISTLFMGIGYASINSIIMNINGKAIAKAQSGVFITNVEYVERENALPNESATINLANGTILNSTIALEPNNENSEVSLKISFYNANSNDAIFKNIFYDSELTDEMEEIYSNLDISYTFTNQNEGIKSKDTLDVIITFKYSNLTDTTLNNLNSILNFEFIYLPIVVGEYDYTGNCSTFIASHSGNYKIETWGAQGGSLSGQDKEGTAISVKGGYGAYSSGNVNLVKNKELYVYVGGVGDAGNPTGDRKGGYNGGGTVIADLATDKDPLNRFVAGGGGATHIAINSNLGELKNYINNVSDVLIVAGGGGGSCFHTTVGYYANGGHAGGSVGNNGENGPKGGFHGLGGSQTAAGYASENPTIGLGGFGYGGNAIGDTFGPHGGAGGGGYYGGGASKASTSANGNSSGGGGSGYIGNILLTNKVMYCYNCFQSNLENDKTISVTNVANKATSFYAKSGNGYAKITLVSLN